MQAACRVGNIEMVRLLSMQFKAPFETSLFTAAKFGHYGVIQFLVQHGACITYCEDPVWTRSEIICAIEKGLRLTQYGTKGKTLHQFLQEVISTPQVCDLIFDFCVMPQFLFFLERCKQCENRT